MSETSLLLTVIIAALISLLAIYFAVAPLLQAGRALPVLEDDKLAELVGRKDSMLQAIKDLEFDFRVGKISQEDYERLDQRLRRQAIGLIQQIERVAPESASLDEQLESIIAQFRQTVSAPAVSIVAAPRAVPAAPAPSKAVAAPRPTATVAAASRFCTECGKPIEEKHKFCAYCGTPVAQADTAAQA